MDRLHQEHNFVQEIWQFMKSCESAENHDAAFWQKAIDRAEHMTDKYRGMDFVAEWLTSYLKYLEKITTEA